MAGFDDDNKALVVGEWFNCRTNHKKRLKAELEREYSSFKYIKNEDSLQTSFQETPSCSRGALRERIAARSGFNAPRVNTEDIFQSTCLTISSPGLSPATLLESPVFLSNPLPSPTTGKLSSLPSDKAKEESFDDITASLAFQSISVSSLDPTNISLEPDDSQGYEQSQLGGLGDSMASGAPTDDGYNWRKYGQKLVKGSEYPRSYYKCTHPSCEVKKKVERSREGHIIEIIYAGSHSHPKPPPNRRSGIGSLGTGLDMQIDGTDQKGFAGTNENIKWTSPVSELEYGIHSGSMQVQSGTQFGYGDAAADAFFRDEYEDDRTSHMSVSLSYNGEVDKSESKRRKLDAAEMSGSTRASHEPIVVVQTTSDIDILDDGYRWRKYGQKVVKGNPNPRSYYKCTASGCTVTKHVERASADFRSVLTTYKGKHTHVVPVARNISHTGLGNSGSLQGDLATHIHYHNVHYPVPHNRSEGMVTANSSLFGFQPHLRPPSGFPIYIGQSELSDLSMPGLTIGQEKLPSLPAPEVGDPDGLMLKLAVEPGLTIGQEKLPSLPAPEVGDPDGLMLKLAVEPKVEPVEPKVEPVEQQGLGLSARSLIYREIVSRLPHL